MQCWPVLLTLLLAATGGLAQSNSSGSTSSTTTQSLSLSLTTSTTTVTTTTRTRGQNSVITSAIPTVFNVTYTISATSSASSSSPSASETPAPIVLETKLDPAFGVLGAILILTGLPSAFWGHKNRWTSFFLIGFYTLALVCVSLILKFGVLPAINPPSKTLRGMFVLSSSIAGFAGGAVAIFFWKAARYCIGGWGGFALALWVQCFRNGGVIRPIAYRWILYIGCGVVGFVLCTIPKIHWHVLLISTAFVGASAFMLGIDCYTTAGLKEFYVWNLGFSSLFPKFKNNGIQFPVSQTMQIELGLISAVALAGSAVQLRILTVLQRKLKEIAEEQKKRDEEAEIEATDRFAHLQREKDEWEKEHPGKLGRYESGFSSVPLMKDQEGSSSPTLHNETRSRHQSGLSEFLVAPTPDDELRRAARNMQGPGALPRLDLGLGIQDDVPQSFMTKEQSQLKDTTVKELEEIKKKEELVAEIQTIRRSIDALKSETTPPSSTVTSRHPSLTSRRTLSMDANSALLPPPTHLRPPREQSPRARVRSMDLSTLAETLGSSINRPTSAPLQDNWDAYVQDRKLLQPPSGVTAPIATTPLEQSSSSRMAISPAVTDALKRRKRRESALNKGGGPGTDSSEDVPLSQTHQHKRSNSAGGNVPVTILPPRKTAAPVETPSPTRPMTRTFEELNERHREKMKNLQAPLTHAEKEQAELAAAKQRWERSKVLEREAVTRRQAEKAAQLEKRKKSDEQERHGRKPGAVERPSARNRHSRSLSADKFANASMSSKRLSTMKVEDWRRYQQELGEAGTGSPSRKAHIPFPDAGQRRSKDVLQ